MGFKWFFKKLLSRGDWPKRRISCCSHTQRNANGKEFLSLCTSAELVIVNGVQGDRFFDSKCTRDSNRSRDGGGSAIDFFACSIEIFQNLQSLHIGEESRFSDQQIDALLVRANVLARHCRGCPWLGCPGNL